ncbi:MAG TPA: PfkB family carbohydrate kinase [Kofleriaceae bacterium]|jgi:fructokinase|nr:PfkB family carbohydrate kinase [Kofleriaceae bacterium]
MSTDQAVIIWGELLWDMFPDGAKLGGAPTNVAWHLGQAGGWARLITRIGDDEPGRRALDELGDLVDTSLVQIDPDRATGEVQVVLDDRGEPRYRLVTDRAWERIACTDDAIGALGEASVVIYGTLAQHTAAGLEGWRAAMNAAHGRCLKVCDVNLRRTEAASAAEDVAVLAALERADVVKVNDRELAALADWLGWRDPIGELRKRPRVVAVTHGADGSTLFGESTAIEIAGVHAATGGDNVGCGDAYLAILVHGMTLGWDLATSGHAASRWAAAVACVRGATPRFEAAHIDDLLELEAA